MMIVPPTWPQQIDDVQLRVSIPVRQSDSAGRITLPTRAGSKGLYKLPCRSPS